MANSSILLDNEEKTEIPAAVRLAQQQGFLSMEKQPVVPVAKLFFSFDIVNSTVYKANTVNWPIITKGYSTIYADVFKGKLTCRELRYGV